MARVMQVEAGRWPCSVLTEMAAVMVAGPAIIGEASGTRERVRRRKLVQRGAGEESTAVLGPSRYNVPRNPASTPAPERRSRTTDWSLTEIQ